MTLSTRYATFDSLLESLAQSDACHQGGGVAPLLQAIGERFDSLKQCLDAAATRRPPTNMAGFSAYISNVWRCRALLLQLQGLRSLRERLNVPGKVWLGYQGLSIIIVVLIWRIYAYGSAHTVELDLLLAALDTAVKGSLYDVLFCLKCILAPYILRYVRVLNCVVC